MQDKTIAIIGLGYVGLPLAVAFGAKRPVLGFDIDARRIDELRAGHDRTRETTAGDLAGARHLRFSSDPADLSVAHSAFRDMGADHIRSLGSADAVLHDLKHILPAQVTDLRL